MSTMNRDYDAILRQALHAAADSVEPSPDGLERIRARIGRSPVLSFASAAAWSADATARIAAWTGPVLRAIAEVFWSVVDRFRPVESGPDDDGPRFGWLRPMAAMGTAIFVVAAGAFAIMTLPQAISSSSSGFTVFPWTTHQDQGGGSGGSAAGIGGSKLPSGATSPGAATGSAVTSPAASKCSALRTAPGGNRPSAPTVSESTAPSTPASGSASPPASSPPTQSSAPATSSSPPPASSSPPVDSSSPGPGDPGAATSPTPQVNPPVAAGDAAQGAGSTG